MAIAGLKSKIFDNAQDLAAWAAVNATTIYEVVCDNNGKYVLFYA